MDPTTQRLFQGAAGAGEVLGVEDVFSTWLYTGNGSTQTITNQIDLTGEGGLAWIKIRDTTGSHFLFDTERGATNEIRTNSTNPENSLAQGLTAFTSTGFTLGSDNAVNGNTSKYISFTFRKAENFFDVVTYAGTSSPQTIAHNLGSVPGCIIVKAINSGSNENWAVYHRSLGNNAYINLNTTAAANTSASFAWNSTSPTATHFTVGSGGAETNGTGYSYVAYLFAHDAGGFGNDGTQSVISCGSYVGTGSPAFINLGWEPQWILVKRSSSISGNANQDSWHIQNNMTNFTSLYNANSLSIQPNTSFAESTYGGWASNSSTGFWTGADTSTNGVEFLYIAIRRGPMKQPEAASEVFNPLTRVGTQTANTFVSTTITPDLAIVRSRNVSAWTAIFDRVRNSGKLIFPPTTTTEVVQNDTLSGFDSMIGVFYGADAANYEVNRSGRAMIDYYFRRAPGFFDIAAYRGDGVAGRTVGHNLAVTPELIIIKRRTTSSDHWAVYNADVGNTKVLFFNLTNAEIASSIYWNNTSPTSSNMTLGATTEVNLSGNDYIAYLFATLPGISKVGSYAGTGTTQQIDCGFTAGARLIIIKRTDSTGDWYVWDTARGISTGTDPYLLINSTAVEDTSTDYIDPYSAGFEISSTAPAAINASGGSFIFLAVA